VREASPGEGHPPSEEDPRAAAVLVALGPAPLSGGQLPEEFPAAGGGPEIRLRDKWDSYETFAARPIDAVVPVDHYIHGCPITRTNSSKWSNAAPGKKPEIPPTRSAWNANGPETCASSSWDEMPGPVTGGCGAWCPTYRITVRDAGEWCRSQHQREKEVLKKYGLTVDQAVGQFRIFLGYSEVAK